MVINLNNADTKNTTEIILEAGHCPHDEDPEVTNNLILNFIQETK